MPDADEPVELGQRPVWAPRRRTSAGADGAGLPPARRSRSESGRVRKPSDERWTEILEKSAAEFAAKGYAATSLQDIADELGILKGSLYYYISSKEDLLFEVIRSVFEDGLNNLRSLVESEGDPADRLARAIEGHVVHLLGNLTASTVFLHEYEQLSPERKRELRVREYPLLFKRLIEDGQAHGVFNPELDAGLMAEAILGSLNWTYRWARREKRAARTIGRQFAQVFLDGLLVGSRSEGIPQSK